MGFGDIFNAYLEKTAAPLRRAQVWLTRKQTKQKLIMTAAAITVCLILSVIITIIAVNITRTKKAGTARVHFTPDKIAGEDVFVPNEPDFLPDIIFEQPRKRAWDEADAAPFWTDPRTLGVEIWQEKMSDTIDTLLERIP